MNHLICSIIINTYNRAPYLRRLLAALARLQGPPFEIIIVNGPSTDGTAALLEEYRGRVKVVDCPTANLSLSRNLGIAAAASDIVAFIDDDALPIDDLWLARYVDAFHNDPSSRLGAVGGSVWHRDTNAYEFNGGATSDYGFQIFDTTIQEQSNLPGQRWCLRVPGGNCAYRRSALVQLGGFDEFFVYYLDEADVCLRLARVGWTISYLAENGIRHYSAPSERRTSKFDRNWRVITQSDTYFALKNGADRLPVRLAKTLIAAPRKHYLKEINSYLYHGEISPLHWMQLIRRWMAGLGSGLVAGLKPMRHTVEFSQAPQPFLPFSEAKPEIPLCIALLTGTIPGQPGYGGIGRYTFDLARGLHERGHDVHIICKDEQPLRYENLGFHIHGIPTSQAVVKQLSVDRPVLNKNLSYALAVVRKLEELNRQGLVFDVVHASNWDLEAVALIRAQIYPVVLMLVSPLAQVISAENWEINADLRDCVAMDRWQIAHADAICVPSAGVLSSYRTLMDIDPATLKRLAVTPLGIVPEPPLPTKPAPARPHRLLFVGRCERRKGAHTLLEILPQLLTNYPDWVCDLVGNDTVPLVDGSTLKERFLARHHNAPWRKRVTFHGMVGEDQLQRFYQQCDLFVAPSLFESFGLIYHEAMQYGKPVVGCRTGGVPEVVEHGVEGLLVAPDSPDELQTALAQLMDDPDTRQHMGAAGARRVREVTNYRSMARLLEQVYLETIDTIGAQRRAGRERLWPRELPLFTPSKDVCLSGEWAPQDIGPIQRYLMGRSGASLRFEASGGSRVQVVALRHAWSGVIEFKIGEAPPRYADLYKSGDMQLAHKIDLFIDGAPTDHVTVIVRVHPERNPESQASEVWLKQIVVSLPFAEKLLV